MSAAAAMRGEVLRALARRPLCISPKHLYDERGAALFEQICTLPEYYPTRCELAIMQAHAPAMARLIGPRAVLVEIGCGHPQKTAPLLAALEELVAYVPVDIEPAQLDRSCASLAARVDAPPCRPVLADFTRPFALPLPPGAAARRAVYFPGSTIGNFDPPQALALLRRLRGLAGRGGVLLVGVDLHKAAAVLEPAYDDAQGVTAAFNLNLLERLNRELGADFDPASFAHRAFYHRRHRRIEMHLVSRHRQAVRVAGRRVGFAAGETIHTERSYKYGVAGFRALAARAGFAAQACWRDPRGWFGVHLLVAA